jgi:RNA polymerase sigma-70 factor (ECF subfamily)
VEPSPTTATSTLWEQFAAPLRAFLARRAPRELDTDDVLQDVFLRIQEQLPNLRDADRVDAWIFQIARNVIADAFRRRALREAHADRAEGAAAVEPVDADDRAGEASLASCLTSMIARLPEPYREAILLTELCGMTQADAAGRVGISLSGMKSRVQRGREHLKRVIGGTCQVAVDVRGGVMACDPLRPSACSRDSMGMSNTNEVKNPESTTTTTEASSGCCGGPAPKDSNACCSLDAEVKASGGAGCGCGPRTATPARKGCC